MEIKVGETYLCGETKVKIIHINKSVNEGGYMYTTDTAIGYAVDDDGDICFAYSVGSFHVDCGRYNSSNPKSLQYRLKSAEVHEVTMAEVNEKFGHEVKIVE